MPINHPRSSSRSRLVQAVLALFIGISAAAGTAGCGGDQASPKKDDLEKTLIETQADLVETCACVKKAVGDDKYNNCNKRIDQAVAAGVDVQNDNVLMADCGPQVVVCKKTYENQVETTHGTDVIPGSIQTVYNCNTAQADWNKIYNIPPAIPGIIYLGTNCWFVSNHNAIGSPNACGNWQPTFKSWKDFGNE